MCGIAAFIAGRAGVTLGEVRAMSQAVRHRGPDDEGYVAFSGARLVPEVFGGPDTPLQCTATGHPYLPPRATSEPRPSYALALGHRRLSIIDLSPAGHQPMCDTQCGIWVVYNGEIYNHVELREELQSLGHLFTSASDTEVLIAAYAQWGVECLSRLNGMFAFVLVDRDRRRVLAARDRFGIKPLYYWRAPSGALAFASEIKQFTVLPGWRATLNGQRAYDFLAWGILDHSDDTLFEGVQQLRNGHFIDIPLDIGVASVKPAQTRWYDLPATRFSGTPAEAAGEFHRLFGDAVKVHLRADVPVGSCLSGGLDSSSVVCLMNLQLRAAGAGRRQQTFSACSKIERFDERRYIEEVVRHTGVQAHYVYPEIQALFSALEQLTWHQDEPFSSTSIFAQWEVFRAAAEAGVKVMLDGQGADEQLAGYPEYLAVNFGHLFRTASFRSVVREMQAVRRLHGYGPIWVAKHLLDTLLPDPLRMALRRLGGKNVDRPSWIDVEAMGAVPGDPLAAAGQRHARSVNELSRAQLMRSNLQMLLHWEDRDSMAHSVEARVPFLDHRLVEFVLGLPPGYKLSNGVTKRVLRDAMKDVLPEAVRSRMDKLGFVTPEVVWARQEAPEAFLQMVDDAVRCSHGVLTPHTCAMAKAMLTGRLPFSFLLWRIVSFGAWMRRFEVTVSRR